MRKTKNVFLDSSAIVGQNLDFSSPSLDRLAGLALIDEVKLLTTTIVIREVEAKFRERILDVEREFSKIRKKHTVLKIASEDVIQGYRTPLDIEKAERDFAARYLKFREESSTVVVPLKLASIDDVFNAYFSSTPPFGDGRKKAEFPDAFNIAALEQWCKDRQEKLYVIAGDGDLAARCEQSDHLIRLSKPSEYIDEYSRESEALRRIEGYVEEHVSELQRAISDAYSNSGFYLEDQDGDVHGVMVDEVEIDDMSLLKVEDNTARFEVTAEINYTAEISYDDMETAIWDSEDKRSIPLHRINTEVHRSVDVTLTAEVALDAEDRYRGIRGVSFSRPDFAITVDDEDPYR